MSAGCCRSGWFGSSSTACVSLALPALRVFDSAGLENIAPATPGAPGKSGDGINEIHLTAGGYRKMAAAFGKFIDEVVDQQFGPL